MADVADGWVINYYRDIHRLLLHNKTTKIVVLGRYQKCQIKFSELQSDTAITRQNYSRNRPVRIDVTIESRVRLREN